VPYDAPPAARVPEEMARFLNWCRISSDRTHPISSNGDHLIS
jgi:hypothetical protein